MLGTSYLVGGAVRDSLLGRPVKDYDYVVVGSTPEALLSVGYRQVGKDFPVFLHPDSSEEYALARTEAKDGIGYHGFSCDFNPEVTIEQDLLRRDLTINAMAKDLVTGKIIDPYNGMADIADRKLRHVSEAFSEDPLRVLRIARFAARYHDLGFTVAKETMTLMSMLAASGELSNLTVERVWQETEAALGTDHPQVYFEVLLECGALKVLFPEVEALYGVPQTAEHHPEIDTFIHTMMVLKRSCELSNDTAVRFASLCHDLGKGTTEQEMLPKHHKHEIRGADLVKLLCARYKVPSRSADLAYLAAKHHTQSHVALVSGHNAHMRLMESTDAFRRPERFAKFLLVCEADAQGRTTFERAHYLQAEVLATELAAALAISTADIANQGFKGKQFGEELYRQRKLAIKRARHMTNYSGLRDILLTPSMQR
jgi:tRNA nucleotidyltransferase (CCA-adding enzyme)